MNKGKFFSVLCLAAVLGTAGCAASPDSAVVREKGSQDMKGYKEDPDRETSLSERLHVPEIYTASGESADGTFQLTCNAETEIPDVKTVSVYEVSQRAMDQELIDQVTDTFFGDLPVYDGNAYFRMPKDEILAKLNELKSCLAAGKSDSAEGTRDEGADGTAGQDPETLQYQIDDLEAAYADAPEVREKKEVQPGFASVENEGEQEEADSELAFFYGAVEMEDAVFSYTLQKHAGRPIQIGIYREDLENQSEGKQWFALGQESVDASDRLSEEEAKEMAGITPEEAVSRANEYMEALGLTDFSAKSTELCVSTAEKESGGTIKTVYNNAFYQVFYTREVDSFPVTEEATYANAVESSDTTLESWAYEDVWFCINKDGLQSANLTNLYHIGEKQVENVKMLDFSEIANIFEKMVQIRYGASEEIALVSLKIDKVTLGYMRIYNPGREHKSGLLVPVWDFFGPVENKREDGKEYTVDSPMVSHLTINAVDGTVIDRSYGY